LEQSGENGECCRWRGRPRLNKVPRGWAAGRCYAPQCDSSEQNESVSLRPEEVAVLDLIDMQGLEQEAAAVVLGVSRKTIWRNIHEARHKIADAILNGKAIQIEGCTRNLEGKCPKRNAALCPKRGVGTCPWIPGEEGPA
jgi:predicted DNA-binding protein (UPF0251 family)